MANYMEMLGAASPTARAVGGVADIFAAMTPPVSSGGAGTASGTPATSPTPGAAATAVATRPGTPPVVHTVRKMAPGLIGAVVGHKVWKAHPLLGAVVGYGVGDNAMELLQGDRKKALLNLAVDVGAVVGCLKYRKLPGPLGRSPLMGALGGALAAAVVTSFIPGSPASGWKAKLGV